MNKIFTDLSFVIQPNIFIMASKQILHVYYCVHWQETLHESCMAGPASPGSLVIVVVTAAGFLLTFL